MPDYEKMYFELLNKTERIVRILTEYQQYIGNLYAEEILAEMNVCDVGDGAEIVQS